MPLVPWSSRGDAQLCGPAIPDSWAGAGPAALGQQAEVGSGAAGKPWLLFPSRALVLLFLGPKSTLPGSRRAHVFLLCKQQPVERELVRCQHKPHKGKHRVRCCRGGGAGTAQSRARPGTADLGTGSGRGALQHLHNVSSCRQPPQSLGHVSQRGERSPWVPPTPLRQEQKPWPGERGYWGDAGCRPQLWGAGQERRDP